MRSSVLLSAPKVARYRLLPIALSCLVAACLACAGRTPVEAPSIVAEPLPEVTRGTYRLQAGDLIAVKFWGIPELDEEQRIRPDGALSLPYVDEVRAAGLTPQELDDHLTQLYSVELARPNITVIVREAVTPRVYISGEVGIQGTVPLTDGLTLFQAIQASGGFLTSARRKEIVLIRRGPEGAPVARAVDLLPVLTGSDPTADPKLAASDIIFVPRTKITNVNLFINQYIDDVLPLQSVFSGAILGIVTTKDDEGSDGPATPVAPSTPDSAGGTP